MNCLKVTSRRKKGLTANVQMVAGICWAQSQFVHIRGESDFQKAL